MTTINICTFYILQFLLAISLGLNVVFGLVLHYTLKTMGQIHANKYKEKNRDQSKQ